MLDHQHNRKPKVLTTRFGATILLGILLASITFTNPVLMGIIGIPVAHAEEMWQSTVGPPVKPKPCTDFLLAAPGLGLCTDTGQAQGTVDRVENAIEFHLLTAALYGFLNAATYLAQTIAYDTASWIADGGPAGGPLFYGKSFGDYITDVSKDALGEFVGTLSEDFTSKFGLNLCKPPSWQAINLSLALSIPDIAIPLKRPTPKCPWAQLTRNWSTAAASLSNADALANIGATFQTGGNDLSYAVALHTPLLDAVAGSEQGAILDRLEGMGYKPVKDYVTGSIKTPSQTVKEQFDQQLIRGPAENEQTTRLGIVMNAFQLGFVEIGKATIATFVNTLTSKLLSKVMKGLFQPSADKGSTLDLTNPFAAPPQATQPQQIFSEQFKDILTPKLTSAEEENTLAELQASCTGGTRTRWSCAIDANLALALTQGGLTVREALDKGFINKNAKLIPASDIQQNQDPSCASNGDRFCVANLRKLRLARIIPIGWELAADSSINNQRCASGVGCITFGEVVSKFDDCNYDTANGGSVRGTLDDAHPWCHLIDPNWVLDAFPSKCTVKGYGNTLLTGTADRQFECQDSVSCLKRDADGKCIGGYGYCLAEQPYWQFQGQSCSEQFVSCRMFTPRGTNAKPIGYLRSSVDYGNCSASNVGCMWYATTRNPLAGDNAWTATYSGTLGKVYFDASASTCDAKNDGCTELKSVVAGQPSINLIQNGSFEEDDSSASGELVGWRRWWTNRSVSGKNFDPLAYAVPAVTTGDVSADGARAIVPPPPGSLGQLVRLTPSHQYTISYYARAGAGAPSAAGVTIQMFPIQGGDPNLVPSKGANQTTDTTFFKTSGCTDTNSVAGSRNTNVNVGIPSTIGSNWQRLQCSFTAPANAVWGLVFVVAGNASAPLIDAVKLEESEVATPFADGLNANLDTVDMKIPPAELGCTGESTDNPLCASYAKVCRENEAGCDGYRLTRQPGAPEIPAVLSAVDSCPSECVGYSEFRKQPSTFDYVHNPSQPLLDDPNDETVAYFVPDTARFCTAADVGCEQFTNLGAAANGGDVSAAYSYLRSCQQPSDAAQTYYTWEGSEDTGFQLRTWSMVRDLTATAPQGPLVVQKPGPDGVLKTPGDCNADTYIRGFDPDCRQFYDPQGNVFYRFESQTVLSDTNCQQFRLDRSSEADCRLTGGAFNAQTNACTYEALGTKSKSCTPAAAGCRGYVGTAGKSQTLVWSDDFTTDTDVSTVKVGPGASSVGLSRSTESVLVGDSSLKAVPTNGSYMYFSVPTESGVMYELTFWAKRAGPPQDVAVSAYTWSDPATRAMGVGNPIGTVSVSSEWRVYRLGPFTSDSNYPNANATEIRLEGLGTASFFIDKIRVERVSDVTYVVKDSWQTPASCDQTPEGIPEPHAMLGCEAYTNRSNVTVNARQFSRLCRETAIGCQAYVNTENTDTPYESRWEKPGSGGVTEVTVKPADHFAYYIPSKAKMCPDSAKGCRAFGLPQFTQDRLALKTDTPFTTVYLKDDPSNYSNALCSQPELFCEAYTYNANGQSSTAYFRAPSDHVCEWKQGVVIPATCDGQDMSRFSGRTYDGWYKTGTSCPCYPDRLITGSVFGLRYTGDAGYNAWVGADQSLYGKNADGTNQTYHGWTATCPQDQAECTEFRDPNDVSDPAHPAGRPYDIVNDSRLDTASCNGQVDPGNGCVLFRDTSDNTMRFSSAATQDAYRERGYRPVSPVDCVGTPDHPSCVRARLTYAKAYAEDHATDGGFTGCLAGAGSAGQTPEQAMISCSGAAAKTGNDTNLVVKVKPDRACSQWLACRTGETVYDPSVGAYKNICSDLALCNSSGETGAEGVPFCTGYVNRTGIGETIFKPYAVTDAMTYATRKVGFGAVDYSGLTIPNHFQIIDAKLKPIGSMLTLDPKTKSSLKKDYRLGVPVPVSSGLVNVSPSAADISSLASVPLLSKYVCILKQTGAMGVLTTSDGLLKKTNDSANPSSVVAAAQTDLCWEAVDQERPPAIGGVATTIVSDNLVVPFLDQRFTQDQNPSQDQMLSRAFPNTQCKASPEATAPFGNAYVIEWDDSVNPPQPKRVVDGYTNATFCEYGEDCECVYKRVGYKGTLKYYEPLSTDVVNAVCQGGPRDGLPCTADVSISGSEPPGGGATGTANVNYQAPHGDSIQQCGSGQCVPITDSTLVRGMTGQCLEYDISRPRAGSSQSECLLWNPNPILTGPGDQYHWEPTSGFKPPQSSGRYYCSSPIRRPRSQYLWPYSWRPNDVPREGFSWTAVALAMYVPAYMEFKASADTGYYIAGANNIGGPVGCGEDMTCIAGVGFMPNSSGNYAGAISALFYADWFTSDGSCVNFLFVGGCTGGESGASIDGQNSDGTQQGNICEEVDDEDQAFIYKTDEMRLVTTGQGTNRSYAEYAFMMNPVEIAYGTLGYTPTDPETVLDFSTEDSISSFEFNVPAGKIGCGYSQEWGDAAVKDWGDVDSWKPQDDAWQANFKKYLQEGGGMLDRKNAQIVTEDGSPTGIPVKVDCVMGDADRSPETQQCFIKSWQIDYRSQGQDKFLAFSPDIGRESLDRLSTHPLYGKCDSSHPWFSIRAVFEDVASSENDLDALEVNPEHLTGPFQFVGLWVSACAPGDQTRYIYMQMKMNSADVCRELVETISKDSHDSTVFTDRNSAQSGYALKNGFTWNTTNIPFGASLATGEAGTQPLYMSGVKQSQVNPLNPPTFTFPGQTYFQSSTYPTSNWGLLSNVFARIYRIYGYSTRSVSRSDWACTNRASPQFGQWCPNLDLVSGSDADAKKKSLAEQYCGYAGKCVKGSLDARNVFGSKVCNSFSGLNRGLDCSGNPDICHIAPMTEQDGVPTPMFGACALFQGYTPADASHGTAIDAKWTSVNKNYRCTGKDCPTGSLSNCTWDGVVGSSNQNGCSRADAVKAGAFRCEAGSVRSPDQVYQSYAGQGETYASYCSKLSTRSHECPLAMPSGSEQCNIESGETVGTCGGSPWAQCKTSADCTFLARNWWPAGDGNNRFMVSGWGEESAWPLGYRDKSLGNTAYPSGSYDFHYAQTDWFGSEFGLRLVENRDAAKAAFYPSVSWDTQLTAGNWTGPTGESTKLFFTAISPSVSGAVWTHTLSYDSWDDRSLMQLMPGFNPLVFWSANGSDYNQLNFGAGKIDMNQVQNSAAPFVYFTKNASWDPNNVSPTMVAHYGACESVALMFRDSKTTSTVIGGTCRGGTRAGAGCGQDSDCRPAGVKLSDADNWCNPVTSGNDTTNPQNSYDRTSVNTDCWPNYSSSNPKNPRLETDPAQDSNICTHPPGYWPRPNYCLDPNDEYCGLFGYDLTNVSNSVKDTVPLPTDVTPGLYTPRFLNPATYPPDSTLKFNYVDYYSPQPPHTAAPDIRTCQGQQCRVAGLDTLSVDGLVGGLANGGVGNHVAALRFYAWASHEQMPLRRVIVDWGDGSTSELPDAYMKNRKPFCDTNKECTDTPGLTCNTDNDCPPGGGSCQSYGNCSNNPNTKCFNDKQCTIGSESGTCEKRIYFGNSSDACEQQYLEFRHAFSCPANAQNVLTACSLSGTSVVGRCSRDNSRTCAAGCGPTDSCVDTMSAPGGCYDSANNRCLFTPRVMIIDNWGWCSGECRGATNQVGKLVDVSKSPVLHPNGGCYDASLVRNNIDFTTAIGPNECSTLSISNSADRPWIVYPGSIVLLPGEAI